MISSLMGGPKPVTSGPIGRCVKRGWCNALILESPKAGGKGVRVVYALTEEGRRLVSQARMGPSMP